MPGRPTALDLCGAVPKGLNLAPPSVDMRQRDLTALRFFPWLHGRSGLWPRTEGATLRPGSQGLAGDTPAMTLSWEKATAPCVGPLASEAPDAVHDF